MEKIGISVIIPVKNNRRYLEPALEAIFAQEARFPFEVIVVDSGSTDNSLNIIAKYPVKLFQIRPKEFNHGLTRNYGISRSEGKYIVLMTPDAIPCDNNWMQRLVDDLEQDGQAAGAYSRQIPHKDSSPLTQIRVKRFFNYSTEKRVSRIDKLEDYQGLPPQAKHRLCVFDNVSSCIRRDVWEKIPFPETDFAEDLEWAEKVLKAGYKIVYDPESSVFHAHDYSIREWYRRNYLNSRKLCDLFGLKPAGNLFQLLFFALAYTFRDSGLLCKERKIKALAYLHLIPLYSFAGLFGGYRGAR